MNPNNVKVLEDVMFAIKKEDGTYEPIGKPVEITASINVSDEGATIHADKINL